MGVPQKKIQPRITRGGRNKTYLTPGSSTFKGLAVAFLRCMTVIPFYWYFESMNVNNRGCYCKKKNKINATFFLFFLNDYSLFFVVFGYFSFSVCLCDNM